MHAACHTCQTAVAWGYGGEPGVLLQNTRTMAASASAVPAPIGGRRSAVHVTMDVYAYY
jgi:hypothetical protein